MWHVVKKSQLYALQHLLQKNLELPLLASFKWQEVCGFEYKSEFIITN